MDYKVLDLEFSAGVNPFTVSKTLGVFPATIAEYYAGNTLNNDLIDLSEYGHTLTDYNTPATSISPLLDQDRNHLVYYALSDSQYFASVHSEWMNCFDANFAMTFVVKSPASAPLSEKMLFCHGETNVSGLYVSMDTSGYYKVVASKSGSNVTSTLSTNKADGYFHVLHIVRSGTSLTLSVDAIAGTTVDPSTFGIDVTETFYLGCYKGPANYWPGGWLYFRLQTSAMETSQISREVALWKGLAGGRGGCSHLVPTYTRAEASLAERVTGRTPMTSVDPNWPAKGPEGGMLVQGAVAQVCQNTRAFDTSPWTTYLPATTVVPANIYGVRYWTGMAASTTGQRLVACTLEGYLYTSTDYGASWTRRVTDYPQRWISVVCDSTGQYMAAAGYYDFIYTSVDWGVTWVSQSASPGRFVWGQMAMNSSGERIFIVANNLIYMSTDRGVSWTTSGAASKSYSCIACDSSGQYVAAGVSNGYIYTSDNWGVGAWTERTGGGQKSWNGITLDKDTGQKLAACVNGEYIWTSTNFGGSFTQRAVVRKWWGISSDSSGTNLIAGSIYGAPIYTSSDSGATWTQRTAAGYGNRQVVICRGSYMFAAESYGYGLLSRSSDYGATWEQITNPNNTENYTYWTAINKVASDSDGSNLIVVSDNARSFISSDFGATWSIIAGLPPQKAWRGVASDSDGSNLIVGDGNSGYVYTSADSGVTWTLRAPAGAGVTKSWYGVASNNDGARLMACAYGGQIYTSSDSGGSWTARDINRSWNGLACSSTGAYGIACTQGPSGYVYVAINNYGSSWSLASSGGYWRAVACSSTGQYMIACTDNTGGSGYIYTNNNYGSGGFTQRASAKNWVGVSCSSTGQYMAAVVTDGKVWTSTNYGVDWAERTSPVGVASSSQVWTSIAVNSTGDKLIAGFYGPCISTDYGVTWTKSLPNIPKIWTRALACSSTMQRIIVAGYGHPSVSNDYGTTWAIAPWLAISFAGVACSSDGRYVVACNNDMNSNLRYIHTSSDYGITWTAITSLSDRVWNAVASDASGRYLTASDNSNIYTSTDYGASWTARQAGGFMSIAMSQGDNGVYRAAGNYGGAFYTSSTSGVSWTSRGGAGSRNWRMVACSDNGQIIIAVVTNETNVYYSPDQGLNWYIRTVTGATATFYTIIACDPSGSTWVYGGYGTPLYKSTDTGLTWTEITAFGNAIWYSVKLTEGAASIIAADGDRVLRFTPTSMEMTCSSASITSPDGTASSFSLISTSANQEHAVIQQMTLTADYYTFEVDVTTGDKGWVYVKNQTVTNAFAYFNVTSGVIGTVGAGCTASVYTRNNRRRCAIHFLGTAATHTFQISPASSDGVLTFAGDGSTPNVYVWEASCHLGTFQTLPVTRSTGAVTRSADNLTYPSDFIPGYVVGNSYINKTLTIELKVRCQYKDTNDIGANTSRPFLCIGGNTGTASGTRNHLVIHGYNQYVYASFYSNDLTNTERYMRHTVTDANQWHKYVLKLNFADLSTSTFTKDDIPYTGSGNLSAAPFDFDATNCLLRIGQTYAGAVTGFCEIDYIKIWVGTS